VFFDVGRNRNEIIVDEGGCFFGSVGLGFQPSTCSSGRRRAEIQ
jgi:hypothetical protein